MRPRHKQQSRQPVKEDGSDPAWHAVSAWRLEVPVDDDYRYDDRHNVHNEREQQVLRDERDRDRRRRQDLRHEQELDVAVVANALDYMQEFS